MTGYTYKIVEGMDFKEWVLYTAQAFSMSSRDGMRDSIEIMKLDPYYEENVADTKSRLDKLRAMSPEQQIEYAQAQIDESINSTKEEIAITTKERELLQAMRDKVEAWSPPSTDHEGLKRYMLQQIDESMRYDSCEDLKAELRSRKSAKVHFEMLLSMAECTYKNAIKRLYEQMEAVAKHNEWVKLLVESLDSRRK